MPGGEEWMRPGGESEVPHGAFVLPHGECLLGQLEARRQPCRGLGGLGGAVIVALSLLLKKNDPRSGGQVAVH
jgi:hypothetical protein